MARRRTTTIYFDHLASRRQYNARALDYGAEPVVIAVQDWRCACGGDLVQAALVLDDGARHGMEDARASARCCSCSALVGELRKQGPDSPFRGAPSAGEQTDPFARIEATAAAMERAERDDSPAARARRLAR